MTYKEFYYWLQGYLYGKIEDNHIATIINQKMNEVKDAEVVFDIEKFRHLGKGNQLITPEYKPIKGDEDDLGHPPKIVM
jgi:hypothetical protein